MGKHSNALNGNPGWSKWERILFKFTFGWVIIFIFSFSFPHSFIPDIGKYTSPYFEHIVKWFAANILKIKRNYISQIISDSLGFYIHALLVVFYAGISTLVWTIIDKNKKAYPLLSYYFLVFIRYYLALQMMVYGYNKLFKYQFYLPEPNTLFTTLGATYKDLLYWSTMGVSRSYTMFGGIMEIIAAVLLLFRRTYIVGGLLFISIMINVAAINFCFDVSVKLYTLFLLLLGIIIVLPFLKKMLILKRGINTK